MESNEDCLMFQGEDHEHLAINISAVAQGTHLQETFIKMSFGL